MANEPTQISSAAPEDFDWLLKLDSHVPPAWVRRCIEHGEYLIARSASEATGFLRFSMFWGVIPFMDLIYVEPDQRSRGVGTLLFLAWQQHMHARGATVLMTSSMADEVGPQAWHERNGFERSGTLTFPSYQAAPEAFFVKQLR